MNGFRFLSTFTNIGKGVNSKEISKTEKLCRKSGIQYTKELIKKHIENKSDNIDIEVGAAIIKNSEGKILVCQRNEGANCGLLWEFPGGKKEKGEHFEECTIRECEEELGIHIEIEKLFAETEYQYPDVKIHFVFFIAKIVSGTLLLNVHKAIKWVKPSQMKELQFCPADIEIVERLQNNTKYYNELVRDNVPGILNSENKVCICDELCGCDYSERLRSEILKKFDLIKKDNYIDNLCDVIELIKAYGTAMGYSKEEIEKSLKEKLQLQGGYYRGMLLKEILQKTD